MDENKKRRLQYHQEAVLKDLDANDIMDDLFTKNAIGKEDYDRIIRISERSERTRYLLGAISNGDNNTFDMFVNCLYKDYKWLYERLNNEEVYDNNVINEDSIEDAFSRGDVPRLPKNCVRRLKLETDIVNCLEQLKRHSALVLRGMLGCGKSTIAASTLRNNPDLIRFKFNGIVMWLNLKDCNTEDEILGQQMKLYRKASAILGYRNPSTVNSTISMSSLSSNLDLSLTNIDVSWQDYRDRLKQIFSESILKDCLVVLNDLSSQLTAEAFDIGCKLMITTIDLDVVSYMDPNVVSISNKFEEQETLELFANCLHTDVTSLPSQATKLHRLYNGDIFEICLLAVHMSGNKERFQYDKKYWNSYVKRLYKSDNIILRWTEHRPIKPIKICIDALDENLRSHFRTLAFLPKNAKLTAKALSTIWSESIPKVEAMLKQLSNKSLLTETYIYDDKNYVYEVHDLILSYLKSLYSLEDMKDLHVKLLHNYGFGADSNSSELLDDNYIALNLGYHIDSTANKNKEWCLFNRLFLDLKFLGNKIRLVGQANVIGDLNKYEDKICLSEPDRHLHMEIIQFLKAYGNDLHKYPYTDIVQSVLQHTTTDILYRHAKDIAKMGSQNRELYFEFLQEPNVEEIIPSVIDVNEPVSCVHFLGNDILVGTKTGKIKVFDVNTCQMSKEITNSSYRIKTISVCERDMSRVAVLSDDGTIAIWPIQFIDEFEVSDEEETRSNSIPSQLTIDCSHGAHVNIQWAYISDMLITHTSRKIIAYNSGGEAVNIFDDFEKNTEVHCMAQASNGQCLMIGASIANSYFVHVLHLRSKEILATFSIQNKPINQIICVPNSANRILVVSESEVTDINWKSNGLNIIPKSLNKSIVTSLNSEDLYYTYAAVNKSGTLIFLSQSNGLVECIDLMKKTNIFTLDNRRGNVIYMDTSERWPDDFLSDADVLVTATGDAEHIVKVWHLETDYVSDMAHKKYRSVRLTGIFTAAFPPIVPQTPQSVTPRKTLSFVIKSEPEKQSVKKTASFDKGSLKLNTLNGTNDFCYDYLNHPHLAVVDDKNVIQILKGRKVKTEIIQREPVAKLEISPCNHYVVYGLRRGIVNKFIMRTKETIPIMDLNSPIAYLEFISNDLLIVAGENGRIMARRDEDNFVKTITCGNTNFGSQEILSELSGSRRMKLSNGENVSDFDSKSDRSNEESPKSERYYGSFKGTLYRGCQLVKCFWLDNIGMLSVDKNASVKLWGTNLEMVTVLNGRRERDGNVDCYITCTAYQNRVLVLCDSYGVFQIFKLLYNDEDDLYLHNLYESQPLNKITACDLSRDGLLLAAATDSGHVILWNIKSKSQINLLRHHKTAIQSLHFSPNHINSMTSSLNDIVSDEVPPDVTPVVLITMATEIIWWNVTQMIRNRQRITSRRGSRNVLTPIYSPTESLNNSLEQSSGSDSRHFFDNNHFEARNSTWKGKKYKSGSSCKEMLACIKLSGVSANRIYINDKFDCFVTVDSTGAIHVMRVMHPTHT